MHRGRSLLPILLAGLLAAPVLADTETAEEEARRPTRREKRDLAAAKKLFERNIQAIVDRDREAYLSCYLATPRLVRTGSPGFTTGYDGLAKSTPATGSSDWPESLESSDLSVTWLRPGLVYGTYRYRVVIDGKTTEGLSERLFLKTLDGWRIAVTTAFSDPPQEEDEDG